MSSANESRDPQPPAAASHTPEPYKQRQPPSRFIWDDASTKALLQGLIDATARGYDTQGGFKEDGWNIALDRVDKLTGKLPTKSQAINKLDSLKKTWKLWKLHRRDTAQWDKRVDGLPQTATDVMNRYFDHYKDRARFRFDLPIFKAQLDKLLGDGTAGGHADASIGGFLDYGSARNAQRDSKSPRGSDGSDGIDDDVAAITPDSDGDATPRNRSRSPSTSARRPFSVASSIASPFSTLAPASPSLSASPVPFSRKRKRMSTDPDQRKRVARDPIREGLRKIKTATNQMCDAMEEMLTSFVVVNRNLRELIYMQNTSPLERALKLFLNEYKHLFPDTWREVPRLFTGRDNGNAIAFLTFRTSDDRVAWVKELLAEDRAERVLSRAESTKAQAQTESRGLSQAIDSTKNP